MTFVDNLSTSIILNKDTQFLIIFITSKNFSSDQEMRSESYTCREGKETRAKTLFCNVKESGIETSQIFATNIQYLI